jgi:MFS family permease
MARGLWDLVTYRVLLGIGESVYLPGGMKVVSQNFKSEETGGAGLFDLGTKLGLALGTRSTSGSSSGTAGARCSSARASRACCG